MYNLQSISNLHKSELKFSSSSSEPRKFTYHLCLLAIMDLKNNLKKYNANMQEAYLIWLLALLGIFYERLSYCCW